MPTEISPTQNAGIWTTFSESPLAVKAVLGGVLVNRIGGFLTIFLVLFMTARGYSTGQAALALGVYGGGSVLGTLIGGALADRLGARDATVLSMAGSAALIAALLYLPRYSLILVAVVLVGAVSQIYRPASATLLSDLTREDRLVMIFAMYRFGLNLGTTAAPLIGFGLYNLGGRRYDLLFWGEALVAAAYAVLALGALPRKVRRGAGTDSDVADGHASATDVADTAPEGSYLDVLRDRRYVFYLVAALSNAVIYVQYLSILPLDVRATGVPIFWYTFAVALNGFAVVVFELLVTRVSQRWPARTTISVGFVLIGLGVAGYGLPLGPTVIVVGTLVWTLGEIIGAPAAFAYPAMAGPAHLRSRYIGSFQFVFGLGSALGPIIGGALFLRLGHAVWPVMAVFSVVATVFGMTAVVSSKASVTPSTAEPTADFDALAGAGPTDEAHTGTPRP